MCYLLSSLNHLVFIEAAPVQGETRLTEGVKPAGMTELVLGEPSIQHHSLSVEEANLSEIADTEQNDMEKDALR